MKKRSYILAVFVALSMTLTACAADQPPSATTAQAEQTTESTQTELVLQIGSPLMHVNGAEQEIDPDRETAPVLVDGRTLLPIRAVVEALGGAVAWDEATQTVTLTYSADELQLTIDAATAYRNGSAQTLDVAPTVMNDRTMLPIRFVAESFRFGVDWNEETETVTITKTEASSASNPQLEDDLVLINGGTFTMGSPANEPEREADEVQHEVRVDSFYMSATELTQQSYQALMGSNPSENQGEMLPVENITWYDAIAYCNALSEAQGPTPCYTIDSGTVTWNRQANGYRLPTEAEWEYAARANTATPFSFGDTVRDEDANCYNAYGYNNGASGRWVNGYLEHSVSVDHYNANAFGLYNMHGNVGEWVWDWYNAYPTAAVENPTGPEAGNYKVARGGGWNDFPKHIRTAYRSAYPADAPLYSIGMRVVRSAESTAGSTVSINRTTTAAPTGNVLIAYFSQTGNTDGLANIIAEMTGADIFRIERETPYSSTGNSQGLYGEALDELRAFAVPNLKAELSDAGLNLDDYDTILLGYCNWWASIPAPVRTFLMHEDFDGKTIIPFCSMGGGRFGQTISAVAKLAPSSTIKAGLDITYSSYDRARISQWLQNNGIAELNQ